jgi:MIP family channel proteins
MKSSYKQYGAEFLGTFVFLLLGFLSLGTDNSTPLWFGLALMISVYTFGPISGAHFNPAVTIGLACVREFPVNKIFGYICSQILGATAAAYCAKAIAEHTSNEAVALISSPGATVSFVQAVIFEVVFTFILLLVISAVATNKRFPAAASGLAIGGAIVILGVVGGSISGASLNPARSIGPALFEGQTMAQLAIYLIGPLIGGILGALVYRLLLVQEPEVVSSQPG